MDGRENLVVRPQDLTEVYAQPRRALHYLAETGAAVHLAPGYYLLVPESLRLNATWRPTIEGLALGVAEADHPSTAGGTTPAALMGPSAARYWQAIPRAIGTATVAVAHQRNVLDTPFGRVTWVCRNTTKLDLQRARTDVTEGWTTSRAQTLLDLADRPTLGGLGAGATTEAIMLLGAKVDSSTWHRIVGLAAAQRKTAGLARLRWLLAAILRDELPGPHPRGMVPSLGLGFPGADADPTRYRIAITDEEQP